ncbi:MAG TPA: hypothetical protein ENK41_02175 [Rhodobacteraceae bacterium]|nr:hypothetical protein [Paracoccaceae bacterium]
MARSSKTKTVTETISGIRVIGPEGGFRRAGHLFGPGETDIPLDSMSKQQIAAIRAEPRLIVTDIEIALAGDAEPAPDGS